MSLEKKNVEIGAGDIFQVPLSIETPLTFAETDILDVLATGGGAVNLGYCDGAGITYAPETTDIKAGQAFAPILRPLVGESGEFKVKLLEQTFKNLQLAYSAEDTAVGTNVKIGAETDDLASALRVGGKRDLPEYVYIYRVRKRENSGSTIQYWYYVLYSASVKDPGELSFANDAERANEVTFSLNPSESVDPSIAGCLFGVYLDDEQSAVS